MKSSQTNVSLTDRASNSRTNEEATGFTMRLNDKQIPEVPLTGQSEESHKKVFEVEEPEQRSRSYDHSRNSESHNSVTGNFLPLSLLFLLQYPRPLRKDESPTLELSLLPQHISNLSFRPSLGFLGYNEW